MATEPGGIASVTHEGFTVSTNSETTEQITENFSSEAKPKDGPAPDPEQEAADKVKKAASELGKKGAEARKAKQDAALQTQGDEETPEPEEEPEKKPEPEPEEERAARPLGKPRDDPRARMLEATRKEAEAKRERDAAKAERDALKAERDALKARYEAKPAEKAAERLGKPVPANYQTTEEYFEAVADWKADEKIKEFKTKAEEEAKVKAYTQTIDDLLGKAVAARKEYEKTDPQFADKLSDEVREIANRPSFARELNEVLQPDHIIADEIIHSAASGPLLMLHLSANPDEVQRLRALRTPQEIQVEMRLLARTLNNAVTAGAAPKGQISKAKPPVRPVTGSPTTADQAEVNDELSFEEHRRRMDAKDRNRRTGRL